MAGPMQGCSHLTLWYLDDMGEIVAEDILNFNFFKENISVWNFSYCLFTTKPVTQPVLTSC